MSSNRSNACPIKLDSQYYKLRGTFFAFYRCTHLASEISRLIENRGQLSMSPGRPSLLPPLRPLSLLTILGSQIETLSTSLSDSSASSSACSESLCCFSVLPPPPCRHLLKLAGLLALRFAVPSTAIKKLWNYSTSH